MVLVSRMSGIPYNTTGIMIPVMTRVTTVTATFSGGYFSDFVLGLLAVVWCSC